MSTKQCGFVDVWFTPLGYGWVHSSDGKFFCHISNIKGQTVPQRGALVMFDKGMGLKGPIALSVEIILGAVEGGGK